MNCIIRPQFLTNSKIISKMKIEVYIYITFSINFYGSQVPNFFTVRTFWSENYEITFEN